MSKTTVETAKTILESIKPSLSQTQVGNEAIHLINNLIMYIEWTEDREEINAVIKKETTKLDSAT